MGKIVFQSLIYCTCGHKDHRHAGYEAKCMLCECLVFEYDGERSKLADEIARDRAQRWRDEG